MLNKQRRQTFSSTRCWYLPHDSLPLGLCCLSVFLPCTYKYRGWLGKGGGTSGSTLVYSEKGLPFTQQKSFRTLNVEYKNTFV